MLGSTGGTFSSVKECDFTVDSGDLFKLDCRFDERDMLSRFLTELIDIFLLNFFELMLSAVKSFVLRC